MAVPDPYANRGFIVTTITNSVDGSFATTSEMPEAGRLDFTVFNAPSLVSPFETECNNILLGRIEKPSDWDTPIVYIEHLFKEDPSSIIIGIHNKGVLFRAAWWWHLRHKRSLPAFAHKSQNLDLAESFNGPAIMTAEERYSFDILKAWDILSDDVNKGSNKDWTGDTSYIKLTWQLTQRLLEQKL
jgi:hypothetical protein